MLQLTVALLKASFDWVGVVSCAITKLVAAQATRAAKVALEKCMFSWCVERIVLVEL